MAPAPAMATARCVAWSRVRRWMPRPLMKRFAPIAPSPNSVTVRATPAAIAKLAAMPIHGAWAATEAISTKIEPTQGQMPETKPVAGSCEAARQRDE
ncbi:hypothetical protein BCC0238_005168 [Burkholderia gladioli]|jgi:hypothetical protein